MRRFQHYPAYMLLFIRLCLKAAQILNRITAFAGRGVAPLTLLMVLLTTAIVLARLVGYGSIAAQETVTYLHALVICLASAYTLQQDGHVRVDIVYRNLSSTRRAWIDCLGTVLFLLPVALFTIAASYPFVAAAWSVREGSADAGGLPAVFLLKSLLLIFGVLLLLQALAQLLVGLRQLIATGEDLAD